MYRKCWTFFLGYCCTRLELRLKWQMLVNMLSEAGLLGSSFSQEEASSCFYFFTFSQESLIRVVLCLRANARSKQGLFETFLPFPFSLSHRKNCIQYDNFSYCCYFCCTLFLKIHCRIFCVLHYKKSKLRILLRSAPLLALQRLESGT